MSSCGFILLLSTVTAQSKCKLNLSKNKISSTKTHSNAVSVTHTVDSNTTSTTGQPWLFFHDEMIDVGGAVLSNIGHGLVCRSYTAFTVGWHFTNGDPVPRFTSGVFGPIPFSQQLTDKKTVPSIARLIRTSPREPDYTHSNGLFTCRLNGSEDGSISVGLYVRGGGEGCGPVMDGWGGGGGGGGGGEMGSSLSPTVNFVSCKGCVKNSSPSHYFWICQCQGNSGAAW